MREMKAEDKLIRARIQIQRKNPFFAYLSLYLKFVESDEVDSCAIDVNGNFFKANRTYSFTVLYPYNMFTGEAYPYTLLVSWDGSPEGDTAFEIKLLPQYEVNMSSKWWKVVGF